MLPARLPNILLNGTTGIAVAWRPIFHRITCVKWLRRQSLNRPAENHARPAAGYRAGAGYPTEAEIITSRAEIRKIYEKDVVQCVCARFGRKKMARWL